MVRFPITSLKTRNVRYKMGLPDVKETIRVFAVSLPGGVVVQQVCGSCCIQLAEDGLPATFLNTEVSQKCILI